LIFLCDAVSLKPTIVLVVGHFLTKISWQYQNSVEQGKFHCSAQNSAARGKLWALIMSLWSSLPMLVSLVAFVSHFSIAVAVDMGMHRVSSV